MRAIKKIYYVMEKNKSAVIEQLAEIAQGLGVDTVGLSTDVATDKAIEAVKSLMEKIEVPKSVGVLAERCRVQVDLADIPELVAHAAADICCSVNPVQYSLDDFKEIYEKAW